jgi:hypothetical protein
MVIYLLSPVYSGFKHPKLAYYVQLDSDCITHTDFVLCTYIFVPLIYIYLRIYVVASMYNSGTHCQTLLLTTILARLTLQATSYFLMRTGYVQWIDH